MENKDCIKLCAYDITGNVVTEEYFSTYDWYERLQSLVDNDSERVRLQVESISGTQYDDHGNVRMQWRNTYLTDGSIASEAIVHSDGTITRNNFIAGLTSRA